MLEEQDQRLDCAASGAAELCVQPLTSAKTALRRALREIVRVLHQGNSWDWKLLHPAQSQCQNT